jgi:alpha-beta hydrolase superfamily lysophospholipase
MFLGGEETVVSNEAARNFYKTSPLKDKSLIQYDDANHAILADREHWPLVAKDVITWINAHID